MIDFLKTSVSQPWAQAVTNLLTWQGKLLDAQYRVGERILETMLSGSRAELTVGLPSRQTTPSAGVERPPGVTSPAQPATPAPVVDRPRAGGEKIKGKVALVTGAASGIGEALVRQLADRGARAIILVDRNERVTELARSINKAAGRQVAEGYVGDTTSDAFRTSVFDDVVARYGPVTICVPAAGITRDRLSVKLDKETGKADVYPSEDFRTVTEVNLIAPIYWALEMVARIAEDRAQRGLPRWEPAEGIQGIVVFIGSVSSQGNKGQISYAVSKAGLEGGAATLMKEAIFYGVRCAVIHPGFTDTPMVRALGEEYIAKYILPYTQLRRLIRPEEIADAICFMISNSAVSGELWADAGWHPSA